ncbi:MAG: hypothetical protein OEV40_09560 [Acidimicrobiia bacterium]|nr:hypothetical protein [Acidimicrobiia bacterium]
MTAIRHGEGSVERRFASATGVLSVAMLAASAANYGLNLGLARLLEPAEFGDASLMVTLLLGLTAVGVALQLLTAREISGAAAADADGIRRHLARRAGLGGLLLAAAMAAAAPGLQVAFHTGSAWPFVVLAAGLPLYLVQSVDRGVLQGRFEFTRLGASFAMEAAVRLVGGLLLVAAGLGVVGATAALSLSFVGSWAVTRPARRRSGARSPRRSPRRSSAATSRATAVLLVGQIVINNGDVVLAKQLLDPETAGSYAAIALIGRAVFFASWAVANAAFPFAAGAATGRRVLRLGVIIVSVLSALAVGMLLLIGDRLAPKLFGAALVDDAALFAPYAAATGMFAVANLIATLDVAADRMDTSLAILGGGILQTVLLLSAGHDPRALVIAQVLAMAILLIATASVHCRSRNTRSLWERGLVVETVG